MPYQVLGDRSGAAAVTVTCTRSARARSSGVIFAMASRTACSPSAFLAPFFPSARSSAARARIAARSSALKPPDSVSMVSVDICTPLVGVRGPDLARALDSEARTRPDAGASRFLTGCHGPRLWGRRWARTDPVRPVGSAAGATTHQQGEVAGLDVLLALVQQRETPSQDAGIPRAGQPGVQDLDTAAHRVPDQQRPLEPPVVDAEQRDGAGLEHP